MIFPLSGKIVFCALARCMLIVGCAPIVWDKLGGTQAQFNVENARCRMVARGLNPGTFYAAGSTEFVAGAVLGNAIGTAANQRQTYRDCMEMKGGPSIFRVMC
jgi:hypothetical protein